MSYLDRLKARAREKHLPEQPSKPSKGAFEGFEGDQSRRVSETRADLTEDEQAAFAERAAIAEFDAAMSREAAEAFAALQVMSAPEGVSAEQMGVVINAAGLFLDRMRAGQRNRGAA